MARKKALDHQVRIIGGSHRSRKIEFPPTGTIRPTANRVRETLFNWLSPIIYGAYCLDLFAGSGALGIEALSRGAAQVVFIDNDRRLCQHIEQTLAQFNLTTARVLQQDAQQFIDADHLYPQPFDIVFLDPPFHKNMLTSLCQTLASSQLLNQHSLIYIEHEKTLNNLSLPQSWQLHREKFTQQTRFALYRVGAQELQTNI